MRWSWPSSSSREYFEMSQNLRLTYVILPVVSVVATMADWSSAKLTSARSLVLDWRSIERAWRSSHVLRNCRSTMAVVQMTGMAIRRELSANKPASVSGATNWPASASTETTVAPRTESAADLRACR